MKAIWKRYAKCVLLVVTVFCIGGAATANPDPPVEAFKVRLKELGHLVVLDDEGKAPQEPVGPKGREPLEEAHFQLRNAPLPPLMQAINQAMESGNKEEVIGALDVYMSIVGEPGRFTAREPLHREYYPILLERLAKDDFELSTYTGALCGALSLYPSRESYVAIMNAARRTKSSKLRDDLIRTTAANLEIELGIHNGTPPVDRGKILADFETWFWKNEKRISFDSQGRSSVAGESGKSKPRNLTAEERARIRKDPVCVLELFQGVTSGVSTTEDQLATLVNQCGDSLFGPEGTSLMKQIVQEAKKLGAPTFDQQMGLAAARGQYPMIDAGLLAVAYVAADDPDPKHRELAKKTLEDIGSPEDITRVLKGETKEVRKKAMALADEMNEPGG